MDSPCVYVQAIDNLSIPSFDCCAHDENEVNDDEDTEIKIMRPKRGLDQNDKTNQTPVNEKSGNSESKSKSEEEAERKENVNIEAVINTDNVQNETRKRKIYSNSSQLTSLHGVSIFFLIFLLPVFSSPMCELISLQEGIISHSLC
jgi:hypothetical protein